MKEVLKAISEGQSQLIGKGEVVKDSWCEVHKVKDKYYAITLYDTSSCWVLEESLEEITEQQIKDYV